MDDDFPAGMLPCIERFLKERRGAFGAFDTELFFPLQRREELRRMLEIAESVQPKIVMEIGADKGAGLLFWLSLPLVKRVIACEIKGTPYWNLFERHFPDKWFRWFQDSHDPNTRLLIGEVLGDDKIDVLFIDGDKGGFMRDFDAYRPLMSDDGIIFMHDIQDSPGPKEAFKETGKRGYRTAKIIDTVESAEALIRKDRGIPPASAHEAWLREWGGRSCGVGVIFMKEGLR